MKKFLLSIGQTLLSTVLLLVVLEAGFRLAGMPAGANRFNEAVIIRNNLSVHKPADEFRIFVYGESSMHGSHYWPYSSPAQWMAVYLRDFLPNKKIRVVNFARMGQGSWRTLESFHDSVAYKPDLVVFYYGHNTFLPGNRKKEVEAKEGKKSAFWRHLMKESRLLSWGYRFAIAKRLQHKKEDAEDSIEYKVIESTPWGLGPENAFPNNSEGYRENLEFFRQNTQAIVSIAEKHRVPAIFCRPVGNMKDFAPFMSVHIKKISTDEEKDFQEAYEKGKKAQSEGKILEALSEFEKAYAIDNTYADLSFRLGSIYFKQGELEKAKNLFTEARDYDAIKVRATTDVLNILDEVKLKGITMVDTEKAVISEAPGGIMGEPIIEDNVHLSIKGHALLGRALAQAIAVKGWIAPLSEWKFQNERPFEVIEKELGVNQELIYAADLKMVSYFGSRYDNRIRFAEKALAIHPDDPKALRHLAWSYWLKGDKTRAFEIYSKLSEAHPAALAEVFHNQPEIKKEFKS